MTTLVYYGNDCIQNDMIINSLDGSRSSPVFEVQSQPIARGIGSAIVNSRIKDKEISLEGTLKLPNGSSIANFATVREYADRIFLEGAQYTRFVPNYIMISDATDVTKWAGSDDAANLANDTIFFQYNHNSVKFDIDVSASGNNDAILTGTLTAVDLSSVATTGSLAVDLYVPDVYYVTSVDFRVGTDSSNYYSYNFTTDYQGQNFKNGWLHLEQLWSNFTTTGTPTTSSTTYVYIKINYSSSAVDINGCRLGGVMWIDEDQVRNFPTYPSSELQKSGNNYENTFCDWSIKLLNYTGYAIGTFPISLFTQAGVTSSQNVQLIDLDGSLNPRVLFTMALPTATSIGSLSIINENTNEELDLIPSSLTANDTIVFGGVNTISTKNGVALDFNGVIPSFELGKNRIALQISGSSPTTTPSSAITSNATRTNPASSPPAAPPNADRYRYISQEFTTTSAQVITSFSIYANTGISGFNEAAKWYIMNDNGSNKPGNTVIASGTLPYSGGITATVNVTGLNIAVSTATKYHLVIEVSHTINYTSVTIPVSASWDYNTSDVYASNIANTSGDQVSDTPVGATWSNATGDQVFSIVQTPSPAWKVDWTASYQKLYLS